MSGDSSTPIRVMVTVPWATREGGAEQMLWDLLAGVDRSRIVLTPVFLEPGPMHLDTLALGLRSHVVRVGRLRNPVRAVRAAAELARCYRTSGPHLLLHWMSKAQIYGAAGALLAGFRDRSLWWQHAVTVGQPMDRVATVLPAIAIATSSGVAAQAQSAVWPRRPTCAIHPGAADRQPSAYDIIATRERLGSVLRPTTIVCVARLQRWKGQLHLIAAVADLVARGHDVGLVLVGGTVFGETDAYERELRATVATLGLSERVHLTGQVPDVSPYLALADIFVSASDVEPFGIALVEAMAARMPIVAVSAGGPREILRDGEFGVLVERPEASLLSAAIERLLLDPARSQALGQRGREHYEQQFTTESMTERFSVFIERVVAARRTAGETAAAASLR